MTRNDAATLTMEEVLAQRFSEIEEKYRREGVLALGEATPEELRELAAIDKQLRELRALKTEEASV